MPDWVVGIAPIEKLKEARNGKPPQSPRALSGEGILLLAPSITPTSVKFALGFLNESLGENLEISDVDTKTKFVLCIQPSDSPQWILDGEFKLHQ